MEKSEIVCFSSLSSNLCYTQKSYGNTFNKDRMLHLFSKQDTTDQTCPVNSMPHESYYKYRAQNTY